MTETFNTNASEKTSAFNTNASEKTQEFNDNVDEKTEQITSQLDNYVQFDNYPSNEKAGVIKPSNNFMVDPSNGYVYAETLDATSYYENTDSTYFISKGTLENIKDDYVGSSQPVQDLTSTVTNIQEEQDENIPKNNAEGTDNVFDDGLESPLFALGGDGKSEQVVTQGYNLLPNNLSSQNINGITITKNNDGSITLNGTATKSTSLVIADLTNFSLQGTYNFYLIGKNNKINLQGVEDGEVVAYLPYSYNTNDYITKEYETAKNLTRIFSYIGSGVTVNNETFKYMITQGSDVKNYEPYSNGIPSPSPDYPQEINSIEGSVEFACRGKSLFGGITLNVTREGITFDTKKDGSVYAKGTALNRALSLFSSEASNNLIEINPGIYTISGGSKNASVELVTDAGTAIASTSTLEPFSTQINIEESKKVFLRVSVEKGKSIDETLYPMLIKGSNNSNWEPYIEPNQVTFNLNEEKLRSVGDVKDELVVDLDTGDYYKVENIGEVVLDGSTDENWSNVPDGTSKERYTSSIIQNLVYVGTRLCQSNYFKSGTNENYYEDGTIKIAPSGGVNIYDDLFTSLDNFKQWLSTHNTIVNYILKKPTTKKLGTLSAENLAKLKTFKGYNNVTVNTNLGLMNIRFTYGLDIKKYIDNKIAELSAQLIKGE